MYNGKDSEKIQNDYILKKVNGINITHVFSSELYGNSVAKALNAQHILVDIERKQINISGTKIRENPKLYKEFMNPFVYNSFINYI